MGGKVHRTSLSTTAAAKQAIDSLGAESIGKTSYRERSISEQNLQSEASPDAFKDSGTTSGDGKDDIIASVALGSNVGDRVRAIEDACRALDKDEDIKVLETSFLYETEPMYVEAQDSFINGVCLLHTKLDPTALLDRLQDIERRLGRVKIIDKGPRSIDLDIIFYGNEAIKTDRLTVPHALMHEREFVLRPLCDFHDLAGMKISSGDRGHKTPIVDVLRDLPRAERPMLSSTTVALGKEPIRPADPARSTRVMSILNVTPDSFSDGGNNLPTDFEALKTTVASHVAQGATMIDVGGQSSRPNAPDISAEQEIARVLPAIKAIQSLPQAAEVIISVDTYRAKVAKAAVEAGAHVVNDISAGLLDPEMLPTVAELGCTYIMMHMRGTPATMSNAENCSYPYGVVQTVAQELHDRVKAALDAGVRRWRIVLDPGIGFAKNQAQNLELLRHMDKLKDNVHLKNFPWLVGTSRKGFIGKITGVQKASERNWGTAATVTAAVRGGADIVRVHDVGEMAKVVKMADAIYRR